MPEWLYWLYWAGTGLIAIMVIAIIATLIKSSRPKKRKRLARGWIFLLVVLGLLSTLLVPPYIAYLLGGVIGGILGGILGGIIGGILGVALTVYLAIWIVPSQIFAPRNMFFTAVSEATAKFIVRGKRWDKTLIAWEGHRLGKKGNVVKGKPKRSWWNRKFGIEFYGLWPWVDVLIYEFSWSGVTQDNRIVRHDKELLEQMILRDDGYLLVLEAAEDKDGLHLYVEIILVIRIINPTKARFNVQNWLEMVIQRSREPLLEYLREVKYEEVLKTKRGQMEAGKAMLKRLEDVGLAGKKGDFEKEYGVRIRAIHLRKVDPPKEYREQTLKKFTAEREAEAIEIKAKAEAKRLETVYSKVQQLGDLGKLLKTLESIEKSPLPASLVIQSVPELRGLRELFSGVFGRSAPTEITKGDIRKLRKELEKMAKVVEKLPGGETRQ